MDQYLRRKIRRKIRERKGIDVSLIGIVQARNNYTQAILLL